MQGNNWMTPSNHDETEEFYWTLDPNTQDMKTRLLDPLQWSTSFHKTDFEYVT